MLFLISRKATQVSKFIHSGTIYFFCILSFVIVSFIFCVIRGLLTFVSCSANSVDEIANSVDEIANFSISPLLAILLILVSCLANFTSFN